MSCLTTIECSSEWIRTFYSPTIPTKSPGQVGWVLSDILWQWTAVIDHVFSPLPLPQRKRVRYSELDFEVRSRPHSLPSPVFALLCASSWGFDWCLEDPVTLLLWCLYPLHLTFRLVVLQFMVELFRVSTALITELPLAVFSIALQRNFRKFFPCVNKLCFTLKREGHGNTPCLPQSWGCRNTELWVFSGSKCGRVCTCEAWWMTKLWNPANLQSI